MQLHQRQAGGCIKDLHPAVLLDHHLYILRQAAQAAVPEVAAQAAVRAAALAAVLAVVQLPATEAVIQLILLAAQLPAMAAVIQPAVQLPAAQEGAPVTCQPPIRKKV